MAAQLGGAKTDDMVDQALTLLSTISPLRLWVIPAWLPREELQYAYYLSRMSPFTEASLTEDTLQPILAALQWARRDFVDLFASPGNAVADRYVTPSYFRGAWDIDGLACPMPSRSFSFPPLYVTCTA